MRAPFRSHARAHRRQLLLEVLVPQTFELVAPRGQTRDLRRQPGDAGADRVERQLRASASR